MSDPILRAFLESQHREGTTLARQSDLLDLLPQRGGNGPPDRYLVRLLCKGLVRDEQGDVVEASEFHVGIWFPPDYLHRVDPLKTITWLCPSNVWHPNISMSPPVICAGRIAPGTALVDLIYVIYEIITYQNWAPHDGLNPAACQWARNNQHRFPTDRRPLKRRTQQLDVTNRENES